MEENGKKKLNFIWIDSEIRVKLYFKSDVEACIFAFLCSKSHCVIFPTLLCSSLSLSPDIPL